jgi:hypothetical protein
MKEYPILFNTAMVKAVLDGRKTQTRRVCRDQTPSKYEYVEDMKTWPEGKNLYTGWAKDIERVGVKIPTKCPFGVVGDRLWVRETWRISGWIEEGEVSLEYKTHNSPHADYIEVDDADLFERLWIQSSDDAEKAGLKPTLLGQYGWKLGEAPTRWRPSIHMPRWACRTVLEITDIRVERIWEITGEDAKAEGWDPDKHLSPTINNTNGRGVGRGRSHYLGSTDKAWVWFKQLWNSINEKRGYGWDVNPWVWVVEFKRVKGDR